MIHELETENKLMSESSAYKDLLYFVGSDILTSDTLICYNLSEDTQVAVQKQHQSKIGPIYDIRISSASTEINCEVLNLQDNKVNSNHTALTLSDMFNEMEL